MGDFILQLPQNVHFSTLLSAEVLEFAIPVLIALVAAISCFLGLRFLLTIIFLGCLVVSGILGLHLIRQIPLIDYVKVLVFLIFMGIGGVAVYALSALFNRLVRKLRLHKLMRFIVSYVIPVLCAGLLFLVLWKRIYTGIPVDAGIAIVILAVGLIVQFKTGIMEREIRRFEDR
jgi:hypothetical protein